MTRAAQPHLEATELRKLLAELLERDRQREREIMELRAMVEAGKSASESEQTERELISPKEAAFRYRVSEKTARRWASSQDKGFEVGGRRFVDASAIEARR
jgi:hypothetical protein